VGYTGAATFNGTPDVPRTFVQQAIFEHIRQQIADSAILIADMTRRSANVFYEIGYAHALKKSVIFLARTKRDIPFDVQHYQTHIYGDNLSGLKSTLKKQIDALANALRPPKIVRLAEEVDEYLDGMGFIQASFESLRPYVTGRASDRDFENLIRVMGHYFTDITIEGGWPGLIQVANRRYW